MTTAPAPPWPTSATRGSRVLHEHLGDEALARTIQLIGDGLYFDDTTGLGDADALGHVREVLGRLGQ